MSSLCSTVTILLVDDDAGHRHLIKRNLKRFQLTNEVIEFEHGLALLDYLGELKKAGKLNEASYVIFLDVRMPKMSGVEVLQELKQDSVYHLIPVIMITTTDDPAEMARCHELGCNSYVTKPIDYDEFVKALDDLGQYFALIKLPNTPRP